MNGFVYLLGASDLRVVTETVVVSLYLFALLISIAISYDCYLFTTMSFSSELAAEVRGSKTIDLIILALLIGDLSLGAATGAFAPIYHMDSRYMNE